jgi:hypothetical protein
MRPRARIRGRGRWWTRRSGSLASCRSACRTSRDGPPCLLALIALLRSAGVPARDGPATAGTFRSPEQESLRPGPHGSIEEAESEPVPGGAWRAGIGRFRLEAAIQSVHADRARRPGGEGGGGGGEPRTGRRRFRPSMKELCASLAPALARADRNRQPHGGRGPGPAAGLALLRRPRPGLPPRPASRYWACARPLSSALGQGGGRRLCEAFDRAIRADRGRGGPPLPCFERRG